MRLFSSSARVDRLEAQSAMTMREVLGSLLFPMLQLADRTGQPTYIRMIADLQLNDRAFLRDALENKWNVGYQHCNALLRDPLPGSAPEIVDHRLSLVGIYGNAALAAWEASRGGSGPPATPCRI
ncbi:hypothetical protein [Paraburkholderia sp. BL10I2N1]|uniref:hypothetical protein n=1 Tax=Paraburkholderia sp. BL10I2N1 TaxID=1938796 RepID=UPI001061299D|nr:hypothetical protein [Paraburkholderia sp. BL10I2N1]